MTSRLICVFSAILSSKRYLYPKMREFISYPNFSLNIQFYMNNIRIHVSITKTTLSFSRHIIHMANTNINSPPLVFWVKFYTSETFLPSFTIKSEAQGKIITESLPDPRDNEYHATFENPFSGRFEFRRINEFRFKYSTTKAKIARKSEGIVSFRNAT
jgi:hypothetical protein